MPTVLEPQREIPVIAEVDVAVAGGGPAGLAAAIAAARLGARTMLVEKNGFFGGMITAGLVLTLGGFNSWVKPYPRVVGGIASEMIRQAAALGGAEDNQSWVLNSEPEIIKLVADRMLTQAGVWFLLHCWAARPWMEGRAVRGIIVENKSGRQAILSRCTIDATGDGDIAARAGAAYEISSTLQPMTLCFQLGGVQGGSQTEIDLPSLTGIESPGIVPGNFMLISRRQDVHVDRAAMREAAGRGELPVYGGPWLGGMRRTQIWVNSTRIFGNCTDACSLTQAEVKGRQDVQAIVRYLTASCPQLKDAHLLMTGPEIGLRESRRIVGDCTLTGDDIRSQRPQPDGIALGCWPIDVHPADGQVGAHDCYVPRPYAIPYRTLLPKGIEGLLAAGRCISADREALGSTRVSGTCMALGEAAGTAAALAVREGVSPRCLDVSRLQRVLEAQGAIIRAP